MTQSRILALNSCTRFTFIFSHSSQRKVIMNSDGKKREWLLTEEGLKRPPWPVVVQNMSFKSGHTMTVTGVPTPDSTSFAINIGTGPEELALHVNPRFNAHGDNRTVVCNSYQGARWCEEYRPDGFPFNQGEEFKVRITFTSEEFTIILPDNSEIHFANRPGAEKYNYIQFEGQVRIQGFEIK